LRPRLVLLSSPRSGQTFPVGPEGLSIGRHPDNRLLVTDHAASRFHCVVEQAEGRFRLRDLESRQGTFVNGRPVREHVLEEGDLVAVGDLLLLFQTKDAEPVRGEPAGLVDEGSFTARTTSQLAPQDALKTRPDFQTLLRIAGILQAARSTEELARGLLDQVLAAVPGDRAALLLADRGSAEIDTAFAARRRGAGDLFPVSRTVVQAVLRDCMALRAEDVLLEERLAGAESLRAERIRSLLAAPLIHLGRTLGLLYVDVQEIDEPARLFDEGHLQILTALAGIAAGALASVRQMEWLEEENRRLTESLASDLVGESPRIREVYRLVGRAAASESTVLLRGESGTGKEMVARALHRESPRAAKPFVAVNCATLSETLLESELFGHEKGAFTGAVARKIGKAEAADGGTLFLDEVGEIPLQLQSKLLRFLQERELDRVGGTHPIRVDVRVVAATNRDLEKAIRDGAFREDLYYRLNVVPLRLPPLRERREDISLLASHFAARISQRLGRPLAGFTPEARACLQRYDWPGNVRELANAVERALVLGEGDLIRPEDLPETVLESGGAPEVSLGQYYETLQETKKRLIRGAVADAGGNITRAAARLGLQPTYLHRLIRNLDLRGEIRDDSAG